MKPYLLPLFIGLGLLVCLVTALEVAAQSPTGQADAPAWQHHSLENRQLTVLAIDQQGQKWFGTSSGTGYPPGSVMQLEPHSRRVYTATELVNSYSVTALAFGPNGHKWFGTGSGVSVFDGQQWQSYTTTHGLLSNEITAIAIEAGGTVWFGTRYGLNAFDGQQWQSYTTTHGLLNNRVNALAMEAQGQVWVGTEAGVSQFDGQHWTSYTTTHGLAFPWVNAIAIDEQGNKWFATHGGGISRFDGATWTSYTAAEGLASNIVYDLAVEPDGTLWAGTTGGVSRFDGTTWTTYTTREGLLDNRVSWVAIDPTGHKWFGYQTRSYYSELDVRQWVTEFDDSRWLPLPASLPAEITLPITLPASAFEVTAPFLVDEPAGRMYVRASQAGQTPLTLVLSLEGEPLAAYNLAGELALDKVNGWLYIDQPGSGGLAVINTRTGRLQTVIALPEEVEKEFYSSPPSPPPLAEPATNRVIAVRDHVVYLADPESGAIVETIPFNLARANSGERITDIQHTQYDPSTGILYLTFITYNCTSAMGGDCDGYTTISYDLENKREITREQGDRPGQALPGYLYSGYFTCIGAYCTGSRTVWRDGQPWLSSSGWGENDGPLVFDPDQHQIYEISPANIRIYDAQTMALLWQSPRPGDGLFIGYETQTKRLLFWEQGEVRGWPVQPPSPEPLVASPTPTTPMQSLAISPAWPADRTLLATWEHPYRNDPGPITPEKASAHLCNFPPLLYLSQDAGQSWARPGGGLAGSCGLATAAFSPNYAHDQTLLGGVPGLGLFKSTDGGQLWQPASLGLRDLRISRILFSPDFMNDQTAFVRSDTWYRSQDGGRQWHPLPLPEIVQDNANHDQTRLILSPEFDRDQTIFALIDKPSEPGELYLSQDGGEQWTGVGDLPPDSRWFWVAPQFAQWQTLFASGPQANQGLLYRSEDGGQTWQVVLSTGQRLVHQLVFAPDLNANRPLFALAGGLYHSPDGGLTWQALEIPSGVTPTALAISPTFAQDRTLFIGTDRGEVLVLAVP